MTRLAILEYPDERLRIIAKPVTRFDADLLRLIDDIVETMYASGGMGLAATQVDVHLQLVVIDVSGTASQPQVFINPRILTRDAIGWVEEGCLSLPGVYENVRRATRVRVRTLDGTGASHERDLEGLAAVCLQHEMDHLQGKLFVDLLSFFKRRRVVKRLNADRHASGRASVSAPVA
jgi:peptide deformylase